MSLLEAVRAAAGGLPGPRRPLAADARVRDLIFVAASVLLIVALAWDNRHYRHVWRDEDETKS